MSEAKSISFSQRILALLQLMRLANVFTAISNVWMGYLLAMRSFEPGLLLFGFTLCSGLLYTAGMVLNDAMDAKIDAKERPDRPIPSGRVSLRVAHVLGWFLLILGLAVSFLLSILCSSAAPGLIAWALSVLIVGYNSSLKHTSLGPLVLGICRALNVLLGMSPLIVQFGVLDFVLVDLPISPALGIGCFVWGIGWFARQEHTTSHRGTLSLGALLMAAGIIVVATGPWWDKPASRLIVESWFWFGMWLLLLSVLLRSILHAVKQPSPELVQKAVVTALMLLIPIDAVICCGYVGWQPACVVLALMIPSKILSPWMKLT